MIGLAKRAARRALRPGAAALTTLTAAALRRFLLSDADAHEIFSRHGFHLLRKSFYHPIPETDDLPPGYYERASELVGVDMNEAGALALLDGPIARYAPELRAAFPLHGEPGTGEFFLMNGSFMAIDAHAYYAIVRHFRPARVTEVGAGYSTLVAAAAARRNEREGAPPALLTAVEPYPQPYMRNGRVPGLRLLESKVEDVPLDEFTALGPGDVLFIDSSHALRDGGDVKYEFLEILPRLRPGVLVHVHDISLPLPYPSWCHRERLFWNEQYILQAFLAFNDRFEVLWPGNYVMLRHPTRVTAVIPEYADMRAAYPHAGPASFWMRVRAG